MIQRGKFHSLTMVNWNGFFARTFDLDDLVTTLSGGNGAGKSTTMAAFITALIPDQSLLHFRNTTEAGSMSASRDKGLHGKLKPGACYAGLEVMNSRNQRLFFGVRLQQVAGRDKKVDIKPFIISGLPSSLKPTDVLIEHISDTQVRVRQLNEIKDALSQHETAHFKAFTSVTDYHAQMFEYGALPKKLRTQNDRSKFYRLIEASLYGGISSAITKSLRDYLLPQNGGVKKAFQDMEVALRENRMTLEAIKLTQRDRDLFKHLITESTHYVASDYMRHANERRKKLELILQRRGELSGSRRKLKDHQHSFSCMTDELNALIDTQGHLEVDYQAASDHFLRAQTAVRQQEKISRYQDDMEALSLRLEEQVMVVEEATEQLSAAEEHAHLSEEEVDSLKSQLADYQQALDVQQTRSLQYQQALSALEKARVITGNENLEQDKAGDVLRVLKEKEETQTATLLSLKHKLDLSFATEKQFERGLVILKGILGHVSRQEAGAKAREVITKGREYAHLGQHSEELLAQQRDLERQMRHFLQAKTLSDQYQSQFNVPILCEESLETERGCQEASLASAEDSVSELTEKSRERLRRENDISIKIAEYEKRAPAWIVAQEKLEKLSEQSEQALTDNQTLLNTLQDVMAKEREMISVRDKLAQEKDILDEEIERLGQPGGSGDARLQSLADTLGGTLLSEIYDDVTLSDAPYFSALYGPARHAIVVPDLKDIKEKLGDIDDCLEDLYIIEGDVDGFDDSVFNADEMEGAVCVHLNERQLRYSPFPKIPLFGRAAREHRLEALREKREEQVEEYAKASFDAQKFQRLTQSFNQFLSSHMGVAFEADPEAAVKVLREERNVILRQQGQEREHEQQARRQLLASKEAIALLNKLHHGVSALEDKTLGARLDEMKARCAQAEQAQQFSRQHAKALLELEALQGTLDADPEQFDALNQAYQSADEALQTLKKQLFSVSDLLERQHHFAYQDAVTLLGKSGELNDQLKIKLTDAEIVRARARENVKRVRDQMNQYNQLFVSLKSAYQSKHETVTEFKRELDDLGVQADVQSQERARICRDELKAQLSQSRLRKSELEKGLTSTELGMASLIKVLKKIVKEYTELRTLVVKTKSGWVGVLKIARTSQVEKQLNRREMAYMSGDELRSLSDKSLGALRIAVSDNEILRDALRASEDMAHPERKVLFYVAVYQHLRERIRHDIIQTDDPIDAIEEMEVELARLTEELTLREKRLSISSESVSSIIRKTIQREQNRVRVLNQGLSNISFGQVMGVRLNVMIRETHTQLLAGLAENADQHQDLFGNNRLTFSEAMSKLFQRLNPHIDFGNRSAQLMGEELLDYRNYLELGIEVNRGTDGWLLAESGALSTGEAIGTGQAILLMVVQSWEDESRRLRAKDMLPCRLLFLDEAARLDVNSISTLFELCHRLDMQLLIAAPENISPEQGTTYKLVRKIFNDKEHVHVVGLRGFSDKFKKIHTEESPDNELPNKELNKQETLDIAQ